MICQVYLLSMCTYLPSGVGETLMGKVSALLRDFPSCTVNEQICLSDRFFHRFLDPDFYSKVTFLVKNKKDTSN